MENTPDTAALADQIGSLSDALAQHRLEFQAAESALVTRIADVDDDRRLTTNRLQRAWQTHHEDIDARLKHQASVFFGALLLVAALLGGALFLAYGQLDSARRALLDDVARLRADYEQLAAVASQDAALQEGLVELSASVAAISESLPQRSETLDPRPRTEETASSDRVQARLAAEPTEQAVPAPIAASAAIRDESAELPPETPRAPEDLAAREERSAPDASPEPDPASDLEPTSGDPSPPDEDAPQSIESTTRTLDIGAETTQAVSVSIAEESVAVGNKPFALQLIGFYSLDDLLDFARREELPARVYFREESYQGRPWFVLIHSLYAGYSDASTAIDRLPTQLAILDTWIRSFPPETRLGILHIER